MKLPHADLAYVPVPKLQRYLLSPTHPIGGAKARWLESAGFQRDDVRALETALLTVARDGEVFETRTGPAWALHSGDGVLRTPSGEALAVRTVWAVELGDDRPRFVTAYPLRKRT